MTATTNTGHRRWLPMMALAALLGTTLATLAPATAQAAEPVPEPGFCGPVTGFAVVWLADPIDQATYELQLSDGQAAFDAAYASLGPDDPAPGLLQEGLAAFPSVLARLTDAVAAAGGNYLDVPEPTRAVYRQDITTFINRTLAYIEPYCSPPAPAGALFGPCTFGPVSLPTLLGVNTTGRPVTATVDGREYQLVPHDDTTDLVIIEVPQGAFEGDVLLDGVPARVAGIGCSSIADDVDTTGFGNLVKADFVPGCSSPATQSTLSLDPNKTLLDSVGLPGIYGGGAAPFDLTVEVDGVTKVVPMPEGQQINLDADAKVPVVTVGGETVDVTVRPASCPDAPSSDGDGASNDDRGAAANDAAPTATPLSPRFTG